MDANSNQWPGSTSSNAGRRSARASRMQMGRTNVLLVGAITLSLGACKPSRSADANATAPVADRTLIPGAPAPTADNNADGKKLDGYVEAHNTFVGTFGFEETMRKYRDAHISSASTRAYFNISPGWIKQGLDKLKAAHAVSGSSTDLDAAADALIASMDKVQTHLASLETYYSSKKYLDDGLARGKAEDAQMLAEFDAAEKDIARFSALLDAALDKRDQALLDTLKGAEPLKYNTKLALFHSKKLVNLFAKPDDASKPDVIAKADAEVALIEKAIADAHEAASKAGKNDPSPLSSLTSMIGSYRSLKQGHDGSDLEDMVQDYNRAVDSSNTFGGME